VIGKRGHDKRDRKTIIKGSSGKKENGQRGGGKQCYRRKQGLTGLMAFGGSLRPRERSGVLNQGKRGRWHYGQKKEHTGKEHWNPRRGRFAFMMSVTKRRSSEKKCSRKELPEEERRKGLARKIRKKRKRGLRGPRRRVSVCSNLHEVHRPRLIHKNPSSIWTQGHTKKTFKKQRNVGEERNAGGTWPRERRRNQKGASKTPCAQEDL